MKLHHIRNVIAVVERGSLRAAAKHLGLAQPAMSRSIRELESELGVVLFERSKLGMTLTPVGKVFFRRARGMHSDIQHALDEIAQYKGEGTGSMTVAFSSAGLLTMLPKVIAPFQKRYPHVRVRVLESSLPVLESDLRDGIADLFYGPVAEDYSDPGLLVEKLFDNPRMIVGRRGHPLQKATSLRELTGASWAASPIGMRTDSEVTSVFEAAGLETPNITMEAGSGISLISMIRSSDLLAVLSAQWSEFIEESRVLERLPISDLPDAPPICAVRRTSMPLTPAAEFWNDLVARVAIQKLRSVQKAASAA